MCVSVPNANQRNVCQSTGGWGGTHIFAGVLTNKSRTKCAKVARICAHRSNILLVVGDIRQRHTREASHRLHPHIRTESTVLIEAPDI